MHRRLAPVRRPTSCRAEGVSARVPLGQMQALDVVKKRFHAVIFALDFVPDVSQSGDSRSASSASFPPITVL